MRSDLPSTPVSKKMIVAGRVISALAVLFLVFDGVIKLMLIAPVVEAFEQLGMPASHAIGIGTLELACATLYVVPRTSVLGAILLTAFLGGATAIHVRSGTPWLFPVVWCVLLWAGIFLRDSRLRALLPLRSSPVDTTRETRSDVRADLSSA